MERERWTVIRRALKAVAGRWRELRVYQHPTRVIALVHLWSVSHDRPTCWACERDNWRGSTPPKPLPDQSTMSRRMRQDDFERFLAEVGDELNRQNVDARAEYQSPLQSQTPPLELLRRIDGKPLLVPKHSGDRDAKIGRGIAGIGRGYKLHLITSGKPMPEAFIITPLNRCEKKAARRLLKHLGRKHPGVCGYLLGDAGYDCSILHDISLGTGGGLQLVCPRNKPGTGLGNCYQSSGRLRAMEILESPRLLNGESPVLNRFGLQLYAQRTEIERDLSQLTCFGGGLEQLPAWVRRPWRVRRWVTGKLLINAARILLREGRAHA